MMPTPRRKVDAWHLVAIIAGAVAGLAGGQRLAPALSPAPCPVCEVCPAVAVEAVVPAPAVVPAASVPLGLVD